MNDKPLSTRLAPEGSQLLQIGIVAALPAELAPLVQNWRLGDRVYQGQVALKGGTSATVYASAAGMGPAAATRAFSNVVSASGGRLDAVISYGWAGALSCGVKPPDTFVVSEVIDSRTGEHFQTASPAAIPLRLVTLDHVARAHEKRPLAERYQAVLVDMEAATVARLARANSIAFLCTKAISDGYMDVLPDFNRFLDREGQLRLPAFVTHALLRPRYWAPLGRLGINSKAAARNLATDWAAQLPACLAGSGLLSCGT